jgi:hypothetical protein
MGKEVAMAVSRREFLQRSGLLAVGAVLPVSALAGTISLKPPVTPGGASAGTGLGNGAVNFDWSQASFQRAVGTEFAVQQTPDQKVWLMLTAVTDSNTVLVTDPGTMTVPPPISSPPPPVDCFILSFRASLAQPLTQGTYAMDHATLGQFPLFVVPAQPGGQMYYAVVNRFVDGTSVKIQPGRIGPPVGITDLPPAGGNPSSGSSGNSGSGGKVTPNPGPNSGPHPGPDQRPMIQPNLSRE